DLHVITFNNVQTPIDNILANGFRIYSQVFDGTIEGNVYFDSNQNGVRDAADFAMSNQKVLLTPGNTIAFTDFNGHYKYYTDSGNYVVSFLPAATYHQTSLPLNYSVSIPPSD